MSNSDSFIVLRSDYPTGHPFQTLGLTGATTAEQLFNATGGVATVGVWSQTAILGAFSPQDPNTPGALTMDQFGRPGIYRGQPRPGQHSGTFDGRAFRVRAQGKFLQNANTTNAQTVTFVITQGNAASSSKRIASVNTTTNLASGSYNWIIEATCLWDSGTQVVYGEFWGNVGGSYGTRAGLSNNVAVTAYTSLLFSASAIFSTASATSTATLVEFSMENV